MISLQDKKVDVKLSIDPETFLAILTFSVDGQSHVFSISFEQLHSLEASIFGIGKETLQAFKNLLFAQGELTKQIMQEKAQT